AINMTVRINKFILAMFHAKMLVITDIYQAIIAGPTIAVYNTFRIYFSANNALQGLFTGIWNNFRIDMAFAFKDAEYNRFTTGSTTSYTGNTLWPEVRFINFDRTGKPSFLPRPVSYFLPHPTKNVGYRASTDTTQLSGIPGRKVHSKIANYLPEFSLGDF